MVDNKYEMFDMPKTNWIDYKVSYLIRPASIHFERWIFGRDLPEAMKKFYRAHNGLDVRIINIEQKEQTDD